MSWTLFLQIVLLLFWATVMMTILVSGDRRFGEGRKKNKCGMKCSEGHQFDKDCSLG